MEPADIRRIKETHRPRLHWFGLNLAFGCVCCGGRRWPCNALMAATDAERRTAQHEVERWQRLILNQQYGRYEQ